MILFPIVLTAASLWLASAILVVSLCRVAGKADADMDDEAREWMSVKRSMLLHQHHIKI